MVQQSGNCAKEIIELAPSCVAVRVSSLGLLPRRMLAVLIGGRVSEERETVRN